MPTATPRLSSPPLYVAFELGQRQWKLSLATESASTPRQRTIAARDCAALGRERTEARRAWALLPTGPVCSCYEAGRDGFWLHRVLTRQGIANVVVDSASIEVNRRQRRAKSDSLDGRALLRWWAEPPGVASGYRCSRRDR